MLAHTSPVGLTFHFRYDEQKRCVGTWGAYEGTEDMSLSADVPALLADRETRAKGIYHCKFIYDGNGYSEAIDSITIHRYFGNEHGKLDKAVSAGAVVQRRYDEGGNLVAYTDSLGATTQWRLDPRGRVLQEIDPLGRSTTYERDAGGHIRRRVDAAGGVTSVVRFAGGIAWTDPIGASFESRFDNRGLVVETIGPNGDALSTATTVTATWWRRSTRSVMSPAGLTTTGAGARPSRTRPVLRFTTPTVCGAICSPSASRTAALSGNEYDGIRQRTSVMGENGRITRYVHGGFRKLCEVHEADGSTTRMKYDREGRLVEVINPKGEVHSIKLNLAGMVLSERTFDGRQLHYKVRLRGPAHHGRERAPPEDLVRVRSGGPAHRATLRR